MTILDVSSEVGSLRAEEECILASFTQRLIEIAAVSGARGSGTSPTAALNAMRLRDAAFLHAHSRRLRLVQCCRDRSFCLFPGRDGRVDIRFSHRIHRYSFDGLRGMARGNLQQEKSRVAGSLTSSLPVRVSVQPC